MLGIHITKQGFFFDAVSVVNFRDGDDELVVADPAVAFVDRHHQVGPAGEHRARRACADSVATASANVVGITTDT